MVGDAAVPPGAWGPALSDAIVPVIKAVGIPPLRLWFRWRFEGLDAIPRSGPALIACNHVSYIDPIINAYVVLRSGRTPRFLAKRELFEAPVLGWILRTTSQIPVHRGTRDRTPLDAAERALDAGEVVVVYPEGTVTSREDHLPMRGKAGLARLALASGVPVLPMASWGSHPVWQKSGRGSLRRGRPLWVKVGAPVQVTQIAEQDPGNDVLRRVTAGVMEALTELVVDLRSRYPEGWDDDG